LHLSLPVKIHNEQIVGAPKMIILLVADIEFVLLVASY